MHYQAAEAGDRAEGAPMTQDGPSPTSHSGKRTEDPETRPEHTRGRAGLLAWGRVILRRSAVALIVLVAFGVGLMVAGGRSSDHPPGHKDGEGAKEQIWTCSMHPQIRQPKPGKCPICGMDLIPATSAGTGSEHPTEVTLGLRERKLAEIETSRVVRRPATAEIRALGKVAYDERRLAYLTAYVEGRIERLYVNFTGVKVRRWQPMVSLYSPELVTAQMELLQAMALKSGHLIPGADETLAAARDKLRLVGLSAAQIRGIEKSRKPMDHITIYAPLGGVVIEKMAKEQMYVKPGTRLFTIADLSRVWVLLDVYEHQMAWVRPGQTVRFTAEAYPGEEFAGTVDFVDPFVTDRLRTVKMRLTVDNKDGRLKPDMFVRAVHTSQVGAEGQAVDREGSAQDPLLIPASAPLLTGTRAVVYVEKEPGTYRGVQVRLGPRVGEHYVVLEGLTEGQRVVTRGAFKLDSSLQIGARPSMMSPEEDHRTADHEQGDGDLPPVKPLEAPRAFQGQLGGVVKAYLAVHHALAHDDFAKAKSSAQGLRKALGAIGPAQLKGEAGKTWESLGKELAEATGKVAGADAIKPAREAFKDISDALIKAVRHFGLPEGQTAILVFCPMAFDNKGGHWIQDVKGVVNPYYGAEMFSCGEEKGLLSPEGSPK